jgi:hypothetical protein
VIFSIEVAPETEVYVQFWSEPLEPVLWEVSSGKRSPPADEWLAGERAARIEALGFTVGGDAENYRRTVDITTAADVAAVPSVSTSSITTVLPKTPRGPFATITALSPSTSCMYTCRCADVPAAAASRCAANVRTTTMAAKDMEWSLKKGMAGRDE